MLRMALIPLIVSPSEGRGFCMHVLPKYDLEDLFIKGGHNSNRAISPRIWNRLRQIICRSFY
jgi:hypothetical protein